MYAVIPNPPVDRLKYIAKTYERQPWIVMDMIDVMSNTVGEGYWFDFFRGGDVISAPLKKALSMLTWSDDQSVGKQSVEGRATISDVRKNEIMQAARNTELAKELVERMSEWDEFKAPSVADKAYSWMATQLAKLFKAGDLDAYTDAVQQFKARGSAIGAWVQETGPNLTQMTYGQVIDAVDEFQPSTDAPPTQYEAVYTFPDKWTVQKLPGDYCEEEADAMQHCGTAERRGSVLYSIRDPKGFPHVTIEYHPKTKDVVQVRGKQNQPPIAKYQKYADEFLATLPRLPKHVEALLKVIRESSSDFDEEYDVELALEWANAGFNASELSGWLDAGLEVGRSDVAEVLASEDVSPAEFTTFPYPVLELIQYDGGGFDTDLIGIARLYVAMAGRMPVRRQTEFEFAVQKKQPLPPGRFKGTEGLAQMLKDDRQRLLEAQDWVDAGRRAKIYAEPGTMAGWWSRGFTPRELERWSEEGIIDSRVAEALVSFGIGAHDLEDLHMGMRSMGGPKADDVKGIVAAVEKKRLSANRSRRRTSVRVARKTSRR